MNPGAPWLMLRSALEARWSCVRSALRPLADAEWAFRKLTLRAGLCAGGGGAGGEGAGFAGQDTEGSNRHNRAEEREDSRTARRTEFREAIHFRSSMSALIRFRIDSPPDCTMDRLDKPVWCQLQCLASPFSGAHQTGRTKRVCLLINGVLISVRWQPRLLPRRAYQPKCRSTARAATNHTASVENR